MYIEWWRKIFLCLSVCLSLSLTMAAAAPARSTHSLPSSCVGSLLLGCLSFIRSFAARSLVHSLTHIHKNTHLAHLIQIARKYRKTMTNTRTNKQWKIHSLTLHLMDTRTNSHEQANESAHVEMLTEKYCTKTPLWPSHTNLSTVLIFLTPFLDWSLKN